MNLEIQGKFAFQELGGLPGFEGFTGAHRNPVGNTSNKNMRMSSYMQRLDLTGAPCKEEP